MYPERTEAMTRGREGDGMSGDSSRLRVMRLVTEAQALGKVAAVQLPTLQLSQLCWCP